MTVVSRVFGLEQSVSGECAAAWMRRWGVDVYACVHNCERLCLDLLSHFFFFFSFALLVPPLESLAGAVFAAERLYTLREFLSCERDNGAPVIPCR